MKTFILIFSLENEDSSYDDHGGSSHGNNFSMRPMGTNPFLQVSKKIQIIYQSFMVVLYLSNFSM